MSQWNRTKWSRTVVPNLFPSVDQFEGLFLGRAFFGTHGEAFFERAHGQETFTLAHAFAHAHACTHTFSPAANKIGNSRGHGDGLWTGASLLTSGWGPLV